MDDHRLAGGDRLVHDGGIVGTELERLRRQGQRDRCEADQGEKRPAAIHGRLRAAIPSLKQISSATPTNGPMKALRLNIHHKRFAFAENEIPPVTPCQQERSLPAALERLHKSVVFHLVERICSCGRERRSRGDYRPVRPMNRRDWEGERKAENRLHWSAGERDRQEFLNEAAGRRSRRMFCVRITPYLIDVTDVTAVCGRAPRLADFCLCGQDWRASPLRRERGRLDPWLAQESLLNGRGGIRDHKGQAYTAPLAPTGRARRQSARTCSSA